MSSYQEVMWWAIRSLGYAHGGLIVTSFVVVAIAGLVGAIQAAATRADAYDVVGRNKNTWTLVPLGGAALVVLDFLTGIGFAWIVGAVLVGLYWFDVRPEIKDLLEDAGYA